MWIFRQPIRIVGTAMVNLVLLSHFPQFLCNTGFNCSTKIFPWQSVALSEVPVSIHDKTEIKKGILWTATCHRTMTLMKTKFTCCMSVKLMFFLMVILNHNTRVFWFFLYTSEFFEAKSLICNPKTATACKSDMRTQP